MCFADSYQIPKLYKRFFNIKFGKNVRVTGKNVAFGSEPYLIKIGDNCTITGGVIFETHDGGIGIFRNKYPGINIFGGIEIGSNVFIGNRTIIMPGVVIGDNVIIGAGSIVTQSFPSNVVIAGVPARIIKSTDEYLENNLKKAVFVHATDPLERKKEILKSLNINNGQK